MRVNAVIPHWNRRDLLATLLANLKQQTRPFDEVIVADNGTPSMTATQTFRIVAITALAPTTQGIQATNGNLEVTFGGIPGEIYTIEATQNLNPIVNWVPVATNLVADANGLLKYVDTQARTLPARFFRARTP